MIPYSMLTDEQKRVINKISKSNKKFSFLTGKPGSGKTEVINHLISKLEDEGKKCIICGTTGTSSRKIGGMTVYMAIGLSADMVERGKYKGHPIEEFLNADLIIIDEASMLDQTLFSALSANLRKGQRVLFAGDMGQLPVIARSSGKRRFTYEELLNTLLFMVVGEEMDTYMLSKVFRQDGDMEFLDALCRLSTEGHFEGINELFTDKYYITKKNEAEKIEQICKILVKAADRLENLPYIASKNCYCDMIHREIFNITKDRPSKTYKSRVVKEPLSDEKTVSKIPKKVLKDIERKVKTAYMNGGDYDTEEQTFFIGEKVLFTHNKKDLNEDKIQISNGTFGIVKELRMRSMIVQIWEEDGKIGKMVEVNREKIKETIQYKDESGKVREFCYQEVIRFPLVPGYAVTCHRIQGATLNSAFIDPRGSFEYGMVYTMLSRVKRREGVYLVHPIKEEHVRVNPFVAEFYRFYEANQRGYNDEELAIFRYRCQVTQDCYLSLEDRKYLMGKELAIAKYDRYEGIAEALKQNHLEEYGHKVSYSFSDVKDIVGLIDQMIKFDGISDKKDPRITHAIGEAILRDDDLVIDNLIKGAYDEYLYPATYGYPNIQRVADDWEAVKSMLSEMRLMIDEPEL